MSVAAKLRKVLSLPATRDEFNARFIDGNQGHPGFMAALDSLRTNDKAAYKQIMGMFENTEELDEAFSALADSVYGKQKSGIRGQNPDAKPEVNERVPPQTDKANKKLLADKPGAAKEKALAGLARRGKKDKPAAEPKPETSAAKPETTEAAGTEAAPPELESSAENVFLIDAGFTEDQIRGMTPDVKSETLSDLGYQPAGADAPPADVPAPAAATAAAPAAAATPAPPAPPPPVPGSVNMAVGQPGTIMMPQPSGFSLDTTDDFSDLAAMGWMLDSEAPPGASYQFLDDAGMGAGSQQFAGAMPPQPRDTIPMLEPADDAMPPASDAAVLSSLIEDAPQQSAMDMSKLSYLPPALDPAAAGPMDMSKLSNLPKPEFTGAPPPTGPNRSSYNPKTGAYEPITSRADAFLKARGLEGFSPGAQVLTRNADRVLRNLPWMVPAGAAMYAGYRANQGGPPTQPPPDTDMMQIINEEADQAVRDAERILGPIGPVRIEPPPAMPRK